MKGFNSNAPDEDEPGQPAGADLQELVRARREQLESAGQQQPAGSQLGASQHQLDEMSQDLQYLSREAPLDGGESTFGGYSQLAGAEPAQHQDQDGRRLDSPSSYAALDERALEQLAPDNVDIQRPLQQAGHAQLPEPAASLHQRDSQPLKPFLVSFMVDARGGAMRGCRHSGVRVIIPPNSAQMPMRITCRYLRRERLVHPPPLMEGEACASKIMEVGPAGARFLAPVLIEVPHFASLRGQEREIIILRSDSGEVWREHLVEADERLVESIISSSQLPDEERAAENVEPAESAGRQQARRLTRIVTNEFPQYFAIISRVRQEVHAVGPAGSSVSSQVAPKVQAIFTEGALTKRIKIGLQKKREAQVDLQDQLEQEEFAADQERPGSPQSNQSQRPGSGGAASKRRRRFLACFGDKGSLEPLDGLGDSSSAGGSSAALRADHSDGAETLSSSPGGSPLRRQRRELVPDDYYIEQEPALILNVEPTTYGKRLASSSAQTDSKLNLLNGLLSTSTRPKKRGLLRRAKRRNKTQLTISQEPAAGDCSPDSDQLPVDSLLSAASRQSQASADEHKRRSCTIQTDSDSVTVNYVTIAGSAREMADAMTATKTTSTGHDDGYVSGSGDLNRQSSFGKGLFAAFGGGGGSGDKSAESQSAKQKRGPPKSKAKAKSKAKKTRGEPADRVESPEPQSLTESDSRLPPEESAKEDSESAATSDQQQQQVDQAASRAESPPQSGKESKQRLKLERQEKLRREKEERKLEESKAKEEKSRKKQEKKLAKSAKRTPPESPVGVAANSADNLRESSTGKGQQSVTFAADQPTSARLDEEHSQLRQLDSIQRVIEETSSEYERAKERLSQEDGRDMIRLSIGDKLVQSSSSAEQQQPTSPEPVEGSKSQPADSQPESAELAKQLPQEPLRPILKQQPSQVSSAADQSEREASSEPQTLSSMASKLVSEATDEAVRAADTLKSPDSSLATETPSGSSKKDLAKKAKEAKRLAKEEKRRLADEAKRLAREAAEAKKAAEAEAKRLAKEAKEEAARLAKELKAEKGRLAKEAKSRLRAAPESAEQRDLSSAALDGSPAEATSSKSSLLSRLFGRGGSTRPKSDKVPPKEAAEAAKSGQSDKPVIVSEMYLSDPDDADGEMILEVNVPTNLIDKRPSEQLNEQPTSQASDSNATAARLAAESTTIDESLASQQVDDAAKDDQSTLVNLSQMATVSLDGDDEDATENVEALDLTQADQSPVSQLASASVSEPARTKSLAEQGDSSEPKDEVIVVEAAQRLTVAAPAEVGAPEVTPVEAPEESTQQEQPKKSKSDLKEAKARKELEAKLEKEAKKRAKEEEKLRLKQAKEEAARLELEAKKAQKAAKEKRKSEAKEAKRLAELAKKQAKQEAKKRPKTPVAAVESPVVAEQPAEDHPAAAGLESRVVVEEHDELDTSNMTPVNTETEVERIVEEVEGDDGVVTRTTRTIETKYVTMRQEETRVAERRDMPLEEYEELQRGAGLSSGEPVEAPSAAYEHPELEAIRATPSYFSAEAALELPADCSERKALKKRLKLNQNLIKRAKKLAAREAKQAKGGAKRAQAEIAVCDEAARQAQKQLGRALKEARRAAKAAAKQHKAMDKVDKKLAKSQKKLEKRQRKLDKRAAKLARKESKRAEKLAKKEAQRAKQLERKSSQRSRKSIKLEDIGNPVLRSSSKMSLGAEQQPAHEMVSREPRDKTVIGAGAGRSSSASPASERELQVELTLDDDQPRVVHTVTRTTIVEAPDGQRRVTETIEEELLSSAEAAQLEAKLNEDDDDDQQEIDVVNELDGLANAPAEPAKQSTE